MLTKHVAEWLDKCPTKWDDNDVIDGALWLIVYDAIEPEEAKVVQIETPDTQLVRDCAQMYKEMFQQEAVGLITSTPMEFI